ncbi:hypothetical protein HPB51_023836 [Rhipicephalus microplus]|uniref:Secreted protein n=1 Tax=Rhipicephalus microplus TaxID=6941 RepID=A0A9J6F937_RHIMP|nr:hypothetical protein HPB51_023836 [Rhipicephalus microplus]
MTVRLAIVAVLVLCWSFAAGGGVSDDSGRGSHTKKRNAMIDLHDSLAKFASSLRNFERKSQQVLNAAVAEEEGGCVFPQAAEDGRHVVSEDNGRPRSRRHRGRGIGDVGSYDAEGGGPFKPNGYATHSAENLVQKRDDESVRVIRIKILHHGHDREEDYHSGVARRLPPKTTPYLVSHWVTASRHRATTMTTRTAKAAMINKKSSALTSTSTLAAYCAQDGAAREVPQNPEDRKDDGGAHRDEEPHGHDQDEQVASGNDESHTDDAQLTRDVHESHADGEGITNVEDNGSFRGRVRGK